MKARMAYCSACDKQVEVMVRPDLPADQEATAEDLVCLAFGETCTGDLCPVFTVPTEEMKRRLEDNR